jgi:hypothetical protein
VTQSAGAPSQNPSSKTFQPHHRYPGSVLKRLPALFAALLAVAVATGVGWARTAREDAPSLGPPAVTRTHAIALARTAARRDLKSGSPLTLVFARDARYGDIDGIPIAETSDGTVTRRPNLPVWAIRFKGEFMAPCPYTCQPLPWEQFVINAQTGSLVVSEYDGSNATYVADVRALAAVCC